MNDKMFFMHMPTLSAMSQKSVNLKMMLDPEAPSCRLWLQRPSGSQWNIVEQH